eukprot:COSAG05_NODE_8639_length_689_cov_1.066553_1_plen_147_part_00
MAVACAHVVGTVSTTKMQLGPRKIDEKFGEFLRPSIFNVLLTSNETQLYQAAWDGKTHDLHKNAAQIGEGGAMRMALSSIGVSSGKRRAWVSRVSSYVRPLTLLTTAERFCSSLCTICVGLILSKQKICHYFMSAYARQNNMWILD